MYTKANLFGHPIHPMLVAFPVASYVGTLVGFAVYAANGHQFWLNLAIGLAVVGVCSAVLAALFGAVDLALGVARGSAARATGIAHASVNVAALGLFLAVVASYESHWNGPATSATLGLALSAAGAALTVAAGALGWRLVQTFHVGVRLTPSQARDDAAVQSTGRILHLRRRSA
ncbi:MAG TPA: DUF2231 domain-containing protein [Acidimicrobiales bacterium]|nr:DUF2231 domain-containing protein [Acidimicrobiales bacterium]